MPTIYMYELWNGKKSLGHYVTQSRLIGKELHVPMYGCLKQPYNKKWEIIKVPIIYRLMKDNGVDCTMRRCLDVRRKSKRQIEILKFRTGL